MDAAAVVESGPFSFKVQPHPLAGSGRGTLWHILSHVANDQLMTEQLAFSPSLESADDLPIAERLVGVFQLMIRYQDTVLPPSERASSGIWEMSRHEFHGELYRTALDGDSPIVLKCETCRRGVP